MNMKRNYIKPSIRLIECQPAKLLTASTSESTDPTNWIDPDGNEVGGPVDPSINGSREMWGGGSIWDDN